MPDAFWIHEMFWVLGGCAVLTLIVLFALWCGKGQEPDFKPKRISEIERNFVQMIGFFVAASLVAFLVPSTRLPIGLIIAVAMVYFCFKHDRLEQARQKRQGG